MIGEESVDLIAEVVVGHLGHVLGQHAPKSVGADVPPHDVDEVATSMYAVFASVKPVIRG